ncbi:TPA: DUF2786 domain-containing protein, partial [Escherichia coli]
MMRRRKVMSDMPHQERLVRRVRKLLELSRNNSNA